MKTMRFLLDADLPTSSTEIVCDFGYEAVNVRDIGMGEAKDSVIANYLKENRLCFITGDYDFSDIRN